MIKRIYQLIKIARKLGTSGALITIDEIYRIPLILKIFFNVITIGSIKESKELNRRSGEKLCDALEKMGTTFIKLGQFLATRPDIIGNEVASDLEKLQDKLPPFNSNEAKKILLNEIGENNFKNIEELSDPIAAASIAQVHLAKLKLEDQTVEVAIKILRPDIEKVFNEELDALMLLAYIVENTIAKTKD